MSIEWMASAKYWICSMYIYQEQISDLSRLDISVTLFSLKFISFLRLFMRAFCFCFRYRSLDFSLWLDRLRWWNSDFSLYVLVNILISRVAITGAKPHEDIKPFETSCTRELKHGHYRSSFLLYWFYELTWCTHYLAAITCSDTFDQNLRRRCPMATTSKLKMIRNFHLAGVK